MLAVMMKSRDAFSNKNTKLALSFSWEKPGYFWSYLVVTQRNLCSLFFASGCIPNEECSNLDGTLLILVHLMIMKFLTYAFLFYQERYSEAVNQKVCATATAGKCCVKGVWTAISQTMRYVKIA